MKELYAINKYLFRYRYALALGFISLFASNFFLVYAPVFVGEAIDALKEGREKNIIYGATLFALACSLGSGVFMFLVRQTIIVTSRKIEYDMKNDIYHHIQSLSINTIRQMNTGDIMSRATSDLNAVRNYFGPCIMYFFNTTFRLIFALSAMISVSPMLTLYALLPAPVLAGMVYFIGKRIQEKSHELQEIYSKMTICVQENLAGKRVVKAFVMEDYETEKFSKINNAYFEKNIELAKIQSWFYPVISFLLGMSILLTMWIGGNKIILGEITIGKFAQFIIYIASLSWPIISIGWITNMFQRAVSGQERINFLLSLKSDVINTPNTIINMPSIKGDIRLENVSFSYPTRPDEFALKDVSMEIMQGEKVAIVGAVGSGKTTLAELILRLYDPTEGNIFIDGINIKLLPINKLRENISFVPQDYFLFSTTISQNIAFGAKTEVSENDIHQAAKASDIMKDILSFPKGFETIIGERGVLLSGGQKQRTSIARAIIRDAPILIFDDSLSAVDTETESIIIKNILSNDKKQTIIFITHRFPICERCDKVFVLENGQVIERGRHEDLIIDTKSSYFTMYQRQTLQEQITIT